MGVVKAIFMHSTILDIVVTSVEIKQVSVCVCVCVRACVRACACVCERKYIAYKHLNIRV